LQLFIILIPIVNRIEDVLVPYKSDL